MSVVSISMPEALLKRLDGFATEHGYTGRSEVVREATRVLLSEFDEPNLEGRALVATVTVLFEHDSASVEERMRRLRHEHEEIVASNEETSRRHLQLYQGLCVLDPRERAIIKARHLRQRPATLAALGKKFGISRERVRQLELRAKAKLRAYVSGDPPPTFDDDAPEGDTAACAALQ